MNMKLLPDSSLFDAINSAFNFDTVDGNILGRMESYSCKMVGQEKALYKKLNGDVVPGVNDMEALSPPQSLSDFSPQSFGRINSSSSGTAEKINRKTLFYLVSTLNAAFHPDYDFSSAKAQEFSKEPSVDWVMRSVERQLNAIARSEFAPLSTALWSALDDSICLRECEIYSYHPDETSDPYSEDGCMWSFNYFFYNCRLKRMVFLTCRAASSQYSCSDSDFEACMDFEGCY